MKRTLSFILAAVLVFSLLPTIAFATEGEAANDGIRIKYDLQGVVAKLGLTWESSSTEAAKLKCVPMTVINYDSTDGFFTFKNSSCGNFTGHSSINYNPIYGFQIANGQWIEFDIFVPKAGTYTMEMWCANVEAEAQKTEVYVNNTLAGKYTNYEIGTVASGATEGQNNRYTKVVDEPRYVEGITFAKAGVHTIKFRGTGGYCSAGTFYLIENTAEKNSCLATITSSIDKTFFNYGVDKSAQITTKLFMNDGTEVADASAYTISYKSDNEAVATVSASGVITPVSPGKANITAYTTNEFGEEVSSTKEINVADDITIKYDVIKHLYTDLGYSDATAVADGSLTKLDETVTNNFYSYAGGTAYDKGSIKYYARVQLMSVNTSMAFKINVPKAGFYRIDVDTLGKNSARCDTDMTLYISKDTRSTYPKDKVGSYNVYDPDIKDGTPLIKHIGVHYFDEPGEYIVNFVLTKGYQLSAGSPYSYVGSFYLVGGDKSTLMNGKISSTADEINVDEGETATVSATGFVSSTTEAATFTYSSSNEAVATVDANGVVTPVSAGKATITATANTDISNKLTKEITVTENKPGEAIEDTKVNFTAFAEVGGTVTDNRQVKETEIGSRITVEATANEGYEFAYWRNASGKYLSSNAKETFTVNTNTAVIAVFDKTTISEEDTTAPVYFYNENGSLIEKKDVALGSTFASAKENVETSLTGYKFDKWSIEDNAVINSILRAVALYKQDGLIYGIYVNGNLNEIKHYGEEVTLIGRDNFSYWKLGDNIISYDKEYTFYTWNKIYLTEVNEGSVAAEPTVAIDNSGESYFISYNVPTGYTLIEAGIVFAKSGVPTIGSFNSKAVAKTGSGQFTAKKGESTENVARGYVIFRDADNSIRVIYAD